MIRCKPEEILVGIPTTRGQKDLICLNARPRSHRPVLVSELDRLGYNNSNSYISFLGREDMIDHGSLVSDNGGQPIWKEQMFRGFGYYQLL